MTLIANLRHAARNHETVTIGGGEFGPAELLAAAQVLESAPFLLPALQDCIDALVIHAPDSWVLVQARNAIAQTAGGAT